MAGIFSTLYIQLISIMNFTSSRASKNKNKKKTIKRYRKFQKIISIKERPTRAQKMLKNKLICDQINETMHLLSTNVKWQGLLFATMQNIETPSTLEKIQSCLWDQISIEEDDLIPYLPYLVR